MMSRMGHSSTRAARVSLHTRRDRDREIASTLDMMAKREFKRSKKRKKPRDGSGTQRARPDENGS
jgi:hypothetical protein